MKSGKVRDSSSVKLLQKPDTVTPSSSSTKDIWDILKEQKLKNKNKSEFKTPKNIN